MTSCAEYKEGIFPLQDGGVGVKPPLNHNQNSPLLVYYEQLTSFEPEIREILKNYIEIAIENENSENIPVIIELFKRGHKPQGLRYALCGRIYNPSESWSPAYMCNDCGNLRPVVSNCDLPFCPSCSNRRSKRLARRYMKILKNYHNPKSPFRLRFMTLTFENEDELTTEYLDECNKAFRRFIRRKKVSKHIWKALKIIEITNKGNGWHLHFHLVYYGRYFDNKPKENKDSLLCELWKSATRGKGIIVDIRKIKDVKSALNELIKYVSKGCCDGSDSRGSDITLPKDAVTYMEVMKGRRKVSLFGFEEKLKDIPDNIPCDKCGCVSWTYMRGCDPDLWEEQNTIRTMQMRSSLGFYIQN